jgi:hypothetical protein
MQYQSIVDTFVQLFPLDNVDLMSSLPGGRKSKSRRVGMRREAAGSGRLQRWTLAKAIEVQRKAKKEKHEDTYRRFCSCSGKEPLTLLLQLTNTSVRRSVRRRVDSRIASLGRFAAQDGIKALMARGFRTPGDVENRLGYYLGQIAR